MTIEYQGKKLIAIRSLARNKTTSRLANLAKDGESIVVDPKGAFFDLKGDGDHYLHAVYRYDRKFPRFLTYLKIFVPPNRQTRNYGTTMD